MTPTKLAVGYTRCSTDLQEGSISQQKMAIELWAQKNGYTIIEWFEDEGRSGTTFLKRPAFVEMLTRAQKGIAGFKYILVYDESRWSRSDPDDSVYFKRKFQNEYGVTVVIINTNSNTGNSVADGVVRFIESFEASEYSKKLGRATLRGSIDNAKKGYSSGGSAPYGYARAAVDKVTGKPLRILEPGQHLNYELEKSSWVLGDPFEVEIVKRIFDLRVKGMGCVSICDMLNREGTPPPKRGRWRNKNQKWSQGTINTILSNQTYCGSRVYNVHPQSHTSGPAKERWFNKEEDWVITQNAHPAIVSKEVFDLANRNRKPYARKNRYYSVSPYLLSGLVKCSNCGFNFSGQSYSVQNIKYYQDGGYLAKGRSVCTSFTIRKEELEQFAIRSIRSKILISDLPDRLEEALRKRLKDTSVGKLHIKEQYEKSLYEVKMKIDRLLTVIENGGEIEEVVNRLKEAKKERRAIEQKIEEIISANLNSQDVTEAREQVEYLMKHFEKVFITAPLHVQKELLRKFIHGILVDRDSDSIILTLKKIPSLKDGYTEIDEPPDTHGKNGNGSSQFFIVQKKVRRQIHRKTDKKCVTESEFETKEPSITLAEGDVQ